MLCCCHHIYKCLLGDPGGAAVAPRTLGGSVSDAVAIDSAACGLPGCLPVLPRRHRCHHADHQPDPQGRQALMLSYHTHIWFFQDALVLTREAPSACTPSLPACLVLQTTGCWLPLSVRPARSCHRAHPYVHRRWGFRSVVKRSQVEEE